VLQRSPCDTHTLGREGPEASQSQIIGAQKEAERSEIEERDDRTATRVSGMNEPMTGAERPNEHRRAEEAILAAIEKRGASLAGILPHCVFVRGFPSTA
jgi:hypothetical protein